MNAPAHGRDGWKLEDFDWDPETGLAKCTYERRLAGAKAETMTTFEPQPSSSRHVNWSLDPNVRAFIEHDRDFPVRLI